ncbi:MAG: type II toxin-antitoxin system death-on-curing family toxin [Candidatus Melainabacteria bacterium]|nr:type II toxin-antitoxin system death-on-curing family toxin [Candidatus Melainabacteria bacterium]
MKTTEPHKGEIIIYKTKDGKTSLDVKLEKETVWLSQKQMAELFDCSADNIGLHLKNIFKAKELNENQVTENSSVTASDGKKYKVKHYNLDAVISIGYRVNSIRGTQFRIWATQVLKDHIIKGYTLNPKRLPEVNFKELEQALVLIKGTLNNKELTSNEATGLLKVITDYANSWILLQQYDKNQLEEPKKKHKPKYIITYEKTLEAISRLKADLKSKKEASDLFGNQKDKSFEGIVANLYQTFAGKELYPSIEDKAAHLLYFIIKDHPFTDGNKRIGAFLFILYLSNNGYLFKADGERKINDNALVALALLIAESNPKQKDVMVKLVMNFISN